MADPEVFCVEIRAWPAANVALQMHSGI